MAKSTRVRPDLFARGFRLPYAPATSFLAAVVCTPALAAEPALALPSASASTAAIAVAAGLTLFTATTSLLHLRHRRRALRRQDELAAENAELRERLDRAQLLLRSEPFVIVTWGGNSGHTEVTGDGELVGGELPSALRFSTWLPPHQASDLERRVAELRADGTTFRMTLWPLDGRVLEAEGRPVLGRAVMRLREITGERLETVHLREEAATAVRERDTIRETLDAIPHPIWQRDGEGRLTFVNAAYAAAVEAKHGADAVERVLEFLDSTVRQEAFRRRALHGAWRARTPAIFAGERRMVDAAEIAGRHGSTGFAIDVSEAEAVRNDLQRQMDAQLRTLDQLPTAVAMFDDGMRLVFCNAAYRSLFQLDQAFIDSRPTDPEILDRLRAERLLPEQSDYRAWKAQRLDAYRSIDTQETVWHLPDGRTLRVVVNPDPRGGITYLFDDLTERLHLETRFMSAMKVQSETLETLTEGVAVFGTDGRLALHNPAFAKLWKLESANLAERPHVDAFILRANALYADEAAWTALRGMVTGLGEDREAITVRMERYDGTVLDCTGAPLPDGSTLLTFVDATASVAAERALQERNEALEQAGALRDNFVHHVSYQLRSPLTNVIGFTQMIADQVIGPLNAKQAEYAGHIMRSSNAVLALIDDILDLASIDTGDMALEPEEVEIGRTIAAAAEGLQDRLAEQSLSLAIDAPDTLGTFRADPKRIRQIVFNLLSNAAGFSRPGQTIRVSAERTDDAVMLTVSDEGRGIPSEIIDRIFDRFETHTAGTRHRGLGLGLSIVRSFVELHGGRVSVRSTPGAGTVVTCIFPADGARPRVAAE
jgi:signal transduction histidine kinase